MKSYDLWIYAYVYFLNDNPECMPVYIWFKYNPYFSVWKYIFIYFVYTLTLPKVRILEIF